eukprot:TRINITY_DN5882_c0_g1_i3.p1 TRINITY_DN5882_c0_g1~~TRINITY_DN5882_c0_g1_i3.p1  ORF type:complete len:254 (+),score=42.22 TRINITY_DN5882_c0_g1_i3:64-825(+)
MCIRDRFLSAFSLLQYFGRRNMYNQAQRYIETMPKFKQLCDERYYEETKNNPKNPKSKEEIRKEVKATFVVEGGYAKPTFLDLILFQLVFSPFFLGRWLYYHLRWIILFNILKRPYGDEEKLEIIRGHMQYPQNRWKHVPEDQKQLYLENELWIPAKFAEYTKEEKERRKQELADSARYKQYQRYMKKHGKNAQTLLYEKVSAPLITSMVWFPQIEIFAQIPVLFSLFCKMYYWSLVIAQYSFFLLIISEVIT